MRIALIAVIALASYYYSSAYGAQNDGFQSVGGDFAKNWLNNSLAKNPKSGSASSRSGSSSGAVSTPWQQGAIEGLRIGFHIGEIYTQAQQGYNISGFNAEVDKYNAWVQQNFGNDPNLMMPKMPMTGYSNVPYTASKPIHTVDGSFNQSQKVLGDAVAWNVGEVMGMPTAAYYTWNPDAIPSGSRSINSEQYGGMGWV